MEDHHHDAEIMRRAEILAKLLSNLISAYERTTIHMDVEEAMTGTIADELYAWRMAVLADASLKHVNTDEDARHWSFDYPLWVIILITMGFCFWLS